MLDRLQGPWLHLLGALAMLALLRPSPSPTPLVSAVRSASVAYEGARPGAALTHLERALAIEPDFAALHPLAVQAALEARDPLAALEHIALAEELLPPDPWRACQEGIALYQSEDAAGAFRAWEGSPEICLQSPEMLQIALEAALLLDDRPRALASLEALTRAAPERVAHRLLLGQVLATLRPEEAIAHLRLAEEMGRGGSPEAEALIRAIVDSRAEDQPAYTLAQVGQTLARQGHWQLAAWAFREALAIDEVYTLARAYLGLCLDQSGGDGLEDLEAAVRSDPQSSLALVFLGMHWRQHGEPERALQALEAAEALEPSNAAIVAELGSTYDALGDVASAREAFLAATDLDPQGGSLWLLLAQFGLAHEIEIETLVLPAARNAFILLPENTAAIDILGYGHFLLGDTRLAERLLLQAVNLGPDRSSSHYHLGLLRHEQGDLAAARTALETAIQLDPGGPYAELAQRTLSNLGLTQP